VPDARDSAALRPDAWPARSPGHALRAEPLDWERDGRDWPNRDRTRFVAANGFRWLVQQAGSGPVALLLHGSGASTHSWAGLLPLLAEDFTVLAVDLPGHGFTRVPGAFRPTLPDVAAAIGGLLRHLGAEPALAVGHSAGAAILARMCLDGLIAPGALVSLNGAFLPFGGLAGRVLSPVAKLLAANPLVPRVIAWRAGERSVIERLLASTGSRISPEGAEIYRRLAGNAGHVAGVLDMTSRWDLRPLARDLPRLKTPLTLVATAGDRTVPPSQSFEVEKLVPGARVVYLRSLGHLAHEERPAEIAELIRSAAKREGVLPEPSA
jgi:magnesium chelatase accessory protein